MTTNRKRLSRKCSRRNGCQTEEIPPKRRTRKSAPLSSDSESEDEQPSRRARFAEEKDLNWKPYESAPLSSDSESEDEQPSRRVRIAEEKDWKPSCENKNGLDRRTTKEKKGKKENLEIKERKEPKRNAKLKRFIPLPMEQKSEDGAAPTLNASLEASSVKPKHPLLDGTYFKIVGRDGDDCLCECTICTRTVVSRKSKGGILMQHLKMMHPDHVGAAKRYVSEQRGIARKKFLTESDNVCEKCKIRPKRKITILKTRVVPSASLKAKQNKVDEALVAFVAEGSCSPSIIEHPAFIKLCKALNPKATLSRETLERKIAELDTTKEALIEKPSESEQ